MQKKLLLMQFLILFLIINSYAKKIAVLVGVYPKKKYEVEAIRKGLIEDIYKMQSFFIDQGFKVYVFLGEKATSQNIINTLKKFSSLSKDDVFVFYFTGEGGKVKDISGDEKDNLDEIYILYDFDKDKNTGYILDDDFYEITKNIKAKKLYIEDACFSGSLNRAPGNRDFYIKSIGFVDIKEKNLINKNIIVAPVLESKIKKQDNKYVVLTASDENKKAILTKNGSIFTSSLYKVLTNKNVYDFNKNGKLEFGEINKAVSQEIKKILKDKLYDDVFNPRLILNNVDKNTDFFQYINENKQKTYSDLESYLDSLIASKKFPILHVTSSKRNYVNGEIINITIYPNGNTGYLHVIYVDKDNLTVLVPNKYDITPIYLKGNEKKIELPLRRWKNIRFIASEPFGKTSVYALILPENLGVKISKNEIFKVMKKGSKEEEELVGKIRGITVIKVNNFAIGKVVFYVKER